MKPAWLPKASRILVFVLVIGISIYLFSIRNQIRQFEAYGYPGIFVFNFLSSATLILPMPGVALTSLMGAVFNPFWVAIAAAGGAALGEMSGYLAGFSGQKIAERTPIYERIECWMKKYGNLTVLVLAFIPNPFFDIAGMMAGALRMPPLRFLSWCVLGKILKMLMFAYGGATVARFFPFQ